jgi:hypothetical protein
MARFCAVQSTSPNTSRVLRLRTNALSATCVSSTSAPFTSAGMQLQPTHHTQPGAPTRRLIHSTSTPHLILRYRAAGARCLRPASCTLHFTSFMLSAFSVKDSNLAAAQSCVGVTGSGASSGSMGDRCTRLCAAYSTCGCCDVLDAVPGGWRWRKLKITRRIPFRGAWPTTRGPHL